MKKEKTLVETIEKLGDARAYSEQAAYFLKCTGAKIEACYVDTRAYFDDKDDVRDIYSVKITRGRRSYTFTYGDSIANTEKRIAMVLGNSDKMLAPRIRKGESIEKIGADSFMSPLKEKRWKEKHSKMLDVLDTDAGQRPDAYSILAGLTTAEPSEDVEEFASEYGYTEIKKTVRIHKAVLEEYANMQKLFTDDELEALSRIA